MPSVSIDSCSLQGSARRLAIGVPTLSFQDAPKRTTNGPRRSVNPTDTEVFHSRKRNRFCNLSRFVPPATSPICPKCGSHRTRSLGPAPFVYHRCDACEYVFRPREEQTAHLCPKCGSHRTRIVGQSGEPPLVHRRCEACGHVWFESFDDE